MQVDFFNDPSELILDVVPNQYGVRQLKWKPNAYMNKKSNNKGVFIAVREISCPTPITDSFALELLGVNHESLLSKDAIERLYSNQEINDLFQFGFQSFGFLLPCNEETTIGVFVKQILAYSESPNAIVVASVLNQFEAYKIIKELDGRIYVLS